MRIIDAIKNTIWAMDPRWLPIMAAIAERRTDAPELIAARRDRPLDNTTKMTLRDGVAVLPVMGPIFPRANLFDQMSGATSLQMLAYDFNAALDDPAVKAILLNIDSPGGVATGINEFAGMVRAAADRKPVWAYVGGAGASAAYWIASAAQKIAMDATAQVGSIGVVTGASIQVEPDANGQLTLDIVSSNAPNKRVDPRTDEGKAAIVATLDQMETVFIDSVASLRGVSRDKVINDFGKGGTLIGRAAVTAGMADAIGTFESTLADLIALTSQQENPTMTTPNPQTTAPAATVQPPATPPALSVESIAASHPDIARAFREEGARLERERIVGLQDLAVDGYETQLTAAIADGKTTPEMFAVQIVKADRAAGTTLLDKMAGDLGTQAPPPATAPAGGKVVDKSAPIEERCKTQWDASPDLRAEFRDSFKSYLAYAKNEEAGNVRILKRA